THPAVDRGAPVSPVARRPAVVDVEHDVALRREVLVEHVLARIAGPILVYVVQVASAVYEDHAGRVRLRSHVFRAIDPGWYFDAVGTRDLYDLGDDPGERQPLRCGRRRELGHRRAGTVRHDEEL